MLRVRPATSGGVRYGPEGAFPPLFTTKLTQSPWFLNTPNVFQPPFLHSFFDVGSVAILATKASTSPAWVVWNAPADPGPYNG
jgi:hypothetical protein